MDSVALIAQPAKVLLIVVLAFVATRVLRRAVHRAVHSVGAAAATTTPRAVRRADTIGDLLRSIGSFGIWSIAGLTILGELGVDLGPLIAGAGIVGVALGFGAQNLVRDFISGIFMLMEDQYGVGDVIDAGPASGVVEAVTLRTTRLRDVQGDVWHIPNGNIERVANKSQQWSRALLDIQVSYLSDSERAAVVIKDVADGMWRDPDWSEEILSEPELWGVENLGPDGVVIRLVVQTRPLSQWNVARELRARIKAAFDAEGIQLAVPLRVYETASSTARISSP